MEGIEYEKDAYSRPLVQVRPEKSWAVRLIMKLSGGHIKTDDQAGYVLIVIVILFIILSIYNFSSTGKSNKSSQLEIQKQRNSMEEMLKDASRYSQ